MKFSCDSCSAQYMIADEKVGPRGVKVRCKKCGHIVFVKRAPSEEAASAPVPAPPPAPTGDLGLDVELGQAFDAMLSEKKSETDQLSIDLSAQSSSRGEEFAVDGFGGSQPQPQSPVSAGVSNEWYVAIHDQQVGPLTPSGIKSRWEGGEIGPDSLVWCSGMSDWKPLSTVPSLADMLAPVPSFGARPKKEPVAAAAPPAAEPAPVASPDSGWQPNAAGALAALANQEMASLPQPEVKNGATTGAKPVGSLVESMNLPDSGGVDPTGAIPLNIKGLDSTGEADLKRTSSVARSAAELRERRSTTRTIVIAVAAFAVITLAGVGGVIVYFDRKTGPARPETVAVAPPAPVAAPPVAAPPPPPAPPAAPPPAVAPPPAAPTAAAAPPVAPAAAPTPAAPSAAPTTPSLQTPPLVAAAPMADQNPPAARASEEPPARAKRSRVEPPPKMTGSKRPQRVAAVEAAPEPEKPKKGSGDPLLDFGSGSESDFEKDLNGPGKKRNVYVPPAPGSDVPSEVSQAQIQEGVASRMGGLRECLSKQEAADPSAHGVLKLRWVIGPDGGVSGVRSMTPELANMPITKCLSGVVKTIRFPRSKTTGQEVIFPFKF